MASAALKEKAMISVKDGKQMMTIYTTELSIGNIKAFLQELKVKYGETYKDIEASSYDENHNPTSFTFELPHLEEYILVKMNPHVAMMGNTDLDARIKVDYSALKVYEEDLDNKKNDVNQTTDKGNEEKVESQVIQSIPDTNDSNPLFTMMTLTIMSASGVCLMKRKKESDL